MATAQHDVMLIKYCSVAALALIVWDHLILLGEEKTIILRSGARFSVPAWVFCVNRYWSIIGMIHINVVLVFLSASEMSNGRCQSLSAMIVLYLIIATFGTNTYLTIRQFQVWEGGRSILYMLITSFVLTHIPGLVLAVLSMKNLYANSTYVPALNTCAVLTKSKLYGAWTCVVVYNTIALVLSLLNGLHRPRHRNVDIISYLKSDGALFFGIVFVLRYAVLILMIKLPTDQFFLPTLFVWPVTSATLSRFIITSEARKIRRDVYVLGSYEMETRQ
ncbi:hypothetical protein BDY19DRAFT_907336 [Irpex rosettiformis]|uniref:Uncharacterized protein n=1 Tax=Irpex rosettiformis TaxID=378272 RepID=A0ACB8U0D4_9APHY|nr:hypothetical protein BDY19DRAFT_907336 [Irpex rosettiformis]